MILAAEIAIAIASREGFKRTGISSGRVAIDRFGLRVSKHIICSKQSSNPSLLNAFVA